MTEPTMTTADAGLVWDAITKQVQGQGRAAADALITTALETAGAMAQTVARNIRRGYRADRYEIACNLTDALGYDRYGVWRNEDANTSADAGYSVEARKHASERRDWRTRLSDAIARLDDDAFRALLDRLATHETWVTIDAADGFDVA